MRDWISTYPGLIFIFSLLYPMIQVKKLPDLITKEDLSFFSTVDYWKLVFEEKKVLPRLIVNVDKFPDIILRWYFIKLQFNSESFDEDIQKLEDEKNEALRSSMFPDRTKKEFDDLILDIIKQRQEAIDNNPDMSFNVEIEKFERKFWNWTKFYQLTLIIDEQTAIMMISTKSEFMRYDATFIVPQDGQEQTSVNLVVW